MAETTEALESRPYLHLRCRTETVLDGPEFTCMNDPLLGMSGTLCEECGEHFPVNEFVWSDTEEGIAAFYERHLTKVSPPIAFLGSRTGGFAVTFLGLIAGILLGIVVGMKVNWLVGVAVALIGSAVVGVVTLLVWIFAVQPLMVRIAFGVPNSRYLR